MTDNRRTRAPRRARAEASDGAEARPSADVAADRATSIRRRMTIVAIGLGVGMIIAAGRAVTLQTVYAEQLKREAAYNYVSTVALDDWRGDVVDRNGNLLATTVHRWALTVDPTRVQLPEQTAAVLGELLGQDPAALADKLGAGEKKRGVAVTGNVAARAARRAIQPTAEALADAFGFPVARLDRPLGLLEYFYQMEQLQIPGVWRIVKTLSQAAEYAARAIAADADRLRFFPSRGRRFAYLARDLSDEQARQIDEARAHWTEVCRERREQRQRCDNPLAAVRVTPEPKRYYPKREVGTQLIGLVGTDGHGLSGVERALDGLLAGGHARAKTVRDRRGRAMYLDGVPEDADLVAYTVEVTIDEKIQAMAEKEINEACLTSGARAGYAIVMHVKTGEILAAASFPSFNPNTFTEWFRDREPLADERRAFAQARDDLQWASSWPLMGKLFPGEHQAVMREARRSLARQYDAFVEYAHAYPDASRANAFLDVYEPGSVTKVFTIAAGIEEGLVTLDYEYDLEDGRFELHDPDENVVRDTSRMDKGNVALVMKKSSNIGAAKIGMDLGAERLERYMHAFGFGSTTGSGFPGEAQGLLMPASEWKLVELANISFGQGFAATGVQLVSALSAVGNGGKLMRPVLVRRILDAEGREVQRWEPTVLRQVVSPKTARTVIDLMQTVVEPDGTGARAYIPAYPVAGKTGTGQKSHLRKRGYAEDMWVSTFFGLAPADDPELAIMILVDEPKAKRHGGGVFAAPAFRNLMRWSLKYLGVPSPYDTGHKVAWLDPATLAERRAEGREASAAAPLDRFAPPVDPDDAGDVPVPDFRGMTMDQVRKMAHEHGLKVRYVGTGLARTQDLPAHGRVPAWSTITVVFQPRTPDAPVSALSRSGAPAAPPSLPPPPRPSPADGAPGGAP